MIYEHRNYYTLPAKQGEWVKDFEESTVPIFERCGGKLVGAWRTDLGGKHNEFTYILAFENQAHRDDFWKKVFSDAEFIAGRKNPLVTHIYNRQLKPMKSSPLQ